MKTLSTIFAALMLTFGLSACNTMSGIGQDVERGGEKLQNAAENKK